MRTVTTCQDNNTTAVMGKVRRWFCADMNISLELLFAIIMKFFRLVSFFSSRFYDNRLYVCGSFTGYDTNLEFITILI